MLFQPGASPHVRGLLGMTLYMKLPIYAVLLYLAASVKGIAPMAVGLGMALAPMVITGSCKIYTIYTSQQVFNGQVIVKISTDGKFLIVGKLNFASDSISVSAKLYADLSNVSNGDVKVLFLADIPDQFRLLTIYGKLKMGFRGSGGDGTDTGYSARLASST